MYFVINVLQNKPQIYGLLMTIVLQFANIRFFFVFFAVILLLGFICGNWLSSGTLQWQAVQS